MAKQNLNVLVVVLYALVVLPDTVLAFDRNDISKPAWSMRSGINSAMQSDRRGKMRRSLCAHVEPISLTQSLIGLPVGAIAGIVGSMLGVGGGVIMVLYYNLPTFVIHVKKICTFRYR
jgi:hypothetical protein